MADWFVDDSVTDNSGTGQTAGSPKKYLWLNDGGGSALFNETTPPAAGDRVNVLQNHVELHGASFATTNNGTRSNPIKIYTVTNLSTPTTLGSKSNSIVDTSVAGGDLTLSGALVVQGFKFISDDNIYKGGDNYFKLIDGELEVQSTTDRPLNAGPATYDGVTILEDSDFTTSASPNAIFVGQAGVFEMCAGKVTQTGATKNLIESFYRGGFAKFISVDLSTSDSIAGALHAEGHGRLEVYDCKLKPGYTVDTPSSPGLEIIFDNSSSSATTSNRDKRQILYSGEATTDTTVIRNAETPGANGYAIKMVPNINVSILQPVRTLAIPLWADFSTSKQIDIYIGNNTRDLDDSEIYPVLTYPGYNQGGSKSKYGRNASWLVNPATHADDTLSSWGGGGLTYMQIMSVTAGGATDGREGPAVLEIFLTADVDVYVDAEPTVT